VRGRNLSVAAETFQPICLSAFLPFPGPAAERQKGGKAVKSLT
jgi:hypothetical protein